MIESARYKNKLVILLLQISIQQQLVKDNVTAGPKHI